MLDLSYVYMDVYLPTLDAGRAAIGDDARIVLDAFPKIAIPAHVTYIATEAQFTPKAVETQYERDRLMFRVRVRIDAALLKDEEDKSVPACRASLMCVSIRMPNGRSNWPMRACRE